MAFVAAAQSGSSRRPERKLTVERVLGSIFISFVLNLTRTQKDLEGFSGCTDEIKRPGRRRGCSTEVQQSEMTAES